MKHVARLAAIGLLVLVALLLARRAGLLDSDPTARTAEGSDPRGSASHVGDAHAAGVQPRPLDPVPRRFGWSDGIDDGLLAQVLDRTASGMDVVLLDLEGNADMVPWLESLVAEDEFGRAVAECRRRYERRQTSRCAWEQDVVLRKDPGGAASVVAVRPRISPDQRLDEPGTPFAPECKAWAQCVAEAWKGRPGAFPQGADDHVTTADDGSQLIALRTGVHHLETQGADAGEYRRIYQDRMARVDERMRKREQAYVDAEDEGVRTRGSRDGLYYNLLLERGQLEDYRAYLEYLQETGEAGP